MEKFVNAQRDFFKKGATHSVDYRKEQLMKLALLIRKNEEKLEKAIFLDFKKSSFDNYTNELALLYLDIKEACNKLGRWSRTKRVRTNLVNFPAKSYIIPEPLGVVLVIGAWNYPYQLSLAPVVAAVAAGNTVIIKPSEIAANTSKAIAELINNNFDPGFLHVVEGGVEETTELLKLKFDKIFFTGSTSVGKIVYQAAALNLTPVTLELGGKSPLFVTETCNIKMAVKRIIWAKFLNAGQTCIAPDYVLVHKSIKDRFLIAAKEEIEKSCFSVDNGNYVQIINDRNMRRLIEMIDNDKIYCGGVYSVENRYIAPTIMSDVTFEDKVMQEEIFGPLLPVLEYDNLDQTIEVLKTKPKPLSCYIFTDNQKIKNKILKELSFGGGAVNEALMHISNSNLPFGGVGQSGIGSYHSEAGFRTFTHYKSILEKPTWFESAVKYYPHTKAKLALIKLMMRL